MKSIIVDPPAQINNLTTITATVVGSGITEYQFAINNGPDCSGATYSIWLPVSQPIAENAGSDGQKSLCVIGRDGKNVTETSPTIVTWIKDTAPPTAVLFGAPTGINSSTILDVTVGGVGVSEYSYDLLSGTNCSSAVYGPWTSANEHIVETPGADGNKTICVIARDAASNVQTSPTIVTWIKDTAIATPTISPASGTYHRTQTVTLSTTTSGATIHYTTDGTNPTSSSPVYSSAISVSSSQTVKAYATKVGLTDSGITSEQYVLNVVTPIAIEAFPQTVNYPSVTWTPHVKFSINSPTNVALFSDELGTSINSPSAVASGSNLMLANPVSASAFSNTIYAKDPVASEYISLGSYTTRLPASFGVKGASSPVRAILKDSVSTGCTAAPNCLIIAGDFLTIHNSAFARIAKIMPDGSVTSYGSGIDGSVFALAMDNAGNLYAGGSFSQADSIAGWKAGFR